MDTIICDISGTHSRVAILQNEKIVKLRDYLTQDIKSIKELLSMYIYLEKIEPTSIVISIAGNVENREGKLHHGMLKINENDLKVLGFEEIIILNDFEALSYGVLDVNKFKEITPIISSEKYLVIGAGTGLGVSIFDNNSTLSNEDAHISINLENIKYTPREIDFLNWYKEKVSSNTIKNGQILSGRGLENIYTYIAGSVLSAEEISQIGTKSAQETFDIFYSFYIKIIIYFTQKYDVKQVFVAGGIIMKNMQYFNQEQEAIWVQKLESIGCRILLDYDVSLYGLKKIALKKFN